MIKCTYFSYARHTLSACVLIKKEHQHLLSYASIINANHFFHFHSFPLSLYFSSMSIRYAFSLFFLWVEWYQWYVSCRNLLLWAFSLHKQMKCLYFPLFIRCEWKWNFAEHFFCHCIKWAKIVEERWWSWPRNVYLPNNEWGWGCFW